MTIRDVLGKASRTLLECGVESARLDAEILLSFALGKDRMYVLINQNEEVESDVLTRFDDFVKRRAKAEPVSYITGTREFMSLPFFVMPGVLIPRPDTEILAEAAIDCAKQKEKVLLLDLCTGSGAIAISVAKYAKNVFADAIDFSSVCTSCAQKNAEENGVSGRVNIKEKDIFDEFDDSKKYDIIVSNPPYIKSGEIFSLDSTVKDYEPALALDGGDDGLSFYRRIISLAPTLFVPGGKLFLEIGHDQAEEINELMEKAGVFSDISFLPDLSGIRRVACATFSPKASTSI